MQNSNNLSAADFLNILSNPKRRKILRTCADGRCTTEQISEILNQNQMAAKKHLHQLQASEMILNDNGKFALTPLGFGCLQCMNSFEFLNENSQFFAEHSFGDITSRFLKRIGDLRNSNFFYGIHLVLPKWSKIASEAKEFLNLIFLNPPIVIAGPIKPRINDGLKINLLIGQNSTITDCNEFVNKLDLSKPTFQHNFEKRIIESVQVNMVMSEKEACVIFPDNNGVTDMHGNFISTDPDFIKWCREFFEYKWKDAMSISRLKYHAIPICLLVISFVK